MATDYNEGHIGVSPPKLGERAAKNKFLILSPISKPIITSITEPVICELDSWFERYGIKAFVTSILRDPEHQLNIIKGLARDNRVDQEFPNILTAKLTGQFEWEGSELVYEWQPAWSRLLNMGVIVNPPMPAETLFDYNRRDKSSGDLKVHKPAGTRIGTSPHFKGTAFDVGGGANRKIAEELEPIEAAFKSGTVKGFKGFLPEHDNNAVHCDCEAPL